MHSKSNLFLIELMIAVFFFALAAAVCIQMFAMGHSINMENEQKEHAIMHSISLAETFEATDGELVAMAEILSGEKKEDESIALYFDENWQSAEEEEAAYEVVLVKSEDEDFSYASIVTTECSSGDEIYSLDTQIYHQKVRGE
ncbi:MAG: hypothetical protein K6G40_00675 [Eubacterium sp.]|nr:hypothetical protein [Eubacterium sp.]